MGQECLIELLEITASYGIYYYPIVSSGRAFRALWKRAYHKFPEWLGAVVYEDPWRAGGHNGLSNSEDPDKPEDPYPRVLELRQVMREFGLHDVPIVMAGGVWYLREWTDWIDNPDLGPIAFQFGTRPLLTQESPISDAWKKRLLTLKPGDIYLNRFSPTGFYSSAVSNPFLDELKERSTRQVAYSITAVGDHTEGFPVGARGRLVYLTPHDKEMAEAWVKMGYTEAMRTPDSTLIFVTPEKSNEILTDQINCMGCLSACLFSNWAQGETGTTGRKADPRSFCIQKTLQAISHSDEVDTQLDVCRPCCLSVFRRPLLCGWVHPYCKRARGEIANGGLKILKSRDCFTPLSWGSQSLAPGFYPGDVWFPAFAGTSIASLRKQSEAIYYIIKTQTNEKKCSQDQRKLILLHF